MAPYLHQTQNRLRVRSDFILRNPQQVALQLAQLKGAAGVKEVIYRRYAGSVAVRFDESRVSGSALLAQMEGFGWLTARNDNAYIDTTVRQLARSMVKGAAMLTLNAVVKPSLLKMVLR
ncbi:hypothetical protein [Pluralibacter gergoviae]|uniref:Uncharacterized protein n=1 Tax=Pluralibacter gergoviae TaxID=61647 RepID=A0AAW8HKT7_PLUGE|nr:hypothetical protein [Pluralibacter gergoviae]AVR02693.1 hypothetical protein A8H26_08345 [Pluralibacter gergoviae]KMK05308.1 hypothetical protein ABW08_08460 [Pluralibacter gergoviae]KMK29492.1 hypothetical protein ABW11_06060 [Pluralibacter gergoviae]MDQ2309114.1 hypothetical protein [Pluralibacter gergoviae]SUB73427.1 Uncharacterised protein [Pluralibacter gergoviae]